MNQIDDAVLLKLIRKHFGAGAGFHTRTVWKDGIDLDEPTLATKAFVADIRALGSGQQPVARNYTPEELHDVAVHTLIPKDFYKCQALGDLVRALERPDGWKPADEPPQRRSENDAHPATAQPEREAGEILRELLACKREFDAIDAKDVPNMDAWSNAFEALQAKWSAARSWSEKEGGAKCQHGEGLTDYCLPCGRVNGGY